MISRYRSHQGKWIQVTKCHPQAVEVTCWLRQLVELWDVHLLLGRCWWRRWNGDHRTQPLGICSLSHPEDLPLMGAWFWGETLSHWSDLSTNGGSYVPLGSPKSWRLDISIFSLRFGWRHVALLNWQRAAAWHSIRDWRLVSMKCRGEGRFSWQVPITEGTLPTTFHICCLYIVVKGNIGRILFAWQSFRFFQLGPACSDRKLSQPIIPRMGEVSITTKTMLFLFWLKAIGYWPTTIRQLLAFIAWLGLRPTIGWDQALRSKGRCHSGPAFCEDGLYQILSPSWVIINHHYPSLTLKHLPLLAVPKVGHPFSGKRNILGIKPRAEKKVYINGVKRRLCTKVYSIVSSYPFRLWLAHCLCTALALPEQSRSVCYTQPWTSLLVGV